MQRTVSYEEDLQRFDAIVARQRAGELCGKELPPEPGDGPYRTARRCVLPVEHDSVRPAGYDDFPPCSAERQGPSR